MKTQQNLCSSFTRDCPKLRLAQISISQWTEGHAELRPCAGQSPTSSEKEPKDSQGSVDASETLAGQQSQTRKAPGCASPFTGPSEEATLRAEGGGRVGQRLQGAGTSRAAGGQREGLSLAPQRGSFSGPRRQIQPPWVRLKERCPSVSLSRP